MPFLCVIVLSRAIQWYKKAAESGDKRAIQRLRNTAPGALPKNVREPRVPLTAVAEPQDEEEEGDNTRTAPTGKQKDKDCIIM